MIDLVWDYNTATNSWAAGASMPTPTSAAGSAVANGRLWIFGGETPGVTTGTVTAYDPGGGGWNEGSSLNVPRAWIGGTAIGNTLVAAGGRNDSTPLATTEVLDAGAASCADPTTTFSEDFDGVTPPALPAGWTATNVQGPAPLWTTSHTGMPTPPFDTPPNAAFVDNPQVVSDKRLDSPSHPDRDRLRSAHLPEQLLHRDHVRRRSAGDQIGGGAFQDIRAAGGSLVVGTYSGTLQTGLDNPLSGRLAWTGNSNNGFITSVVILPPSAAGQNVVLRWRLGTDNAIGAPGWRIDTIKISECLGSPPPASTSASATTATPTAAAASTPAASTSATGVPRGIDAGDDRRLLLRPGHLGRPGRDDRLLGKRRNRAAHGHVGYRE